ncbi:hypothetical protein [Agromyces sp. Leaf222]|uniref:hypothetical protein n=1 Tax=Agromyces sp. Leaf222 TaxID=1735688 RepID=UPI0006FED5FB|nr:hypothetical protein [Agromyces sp. Leaf222]KQM83459.1 hypothetical protein ASE68_09685 [Agromyces sp. Leaf222]
MTAPLADAPRAEAPRAAPRAERVEELQARIRGMQGTRLDTKAVPTHPAFADVLPGGTLREGTIVQVEGSMTLLMALLAGPSAGGRWAAIIGMPEFGVEAASRFGISLERLALVPDPGDQWLAVAAALADVIPIVAVRPNGRVSPAEASRLQARLRQRGATLLVAGAWPGSDARLGLGASEWHGIERGHGHLVDREVIVNVAGRGEFVRRAGSRMQLPGRSLEFAQVSSLPVPTVPTVPATTPAIGLGLVAPLRAIPPLGLVGEARRRAG